MISRRRLLAGAGTAAPFAPRRAPAQERLVNLKTAKALKLTLPPVVRDAERIIT